MAYEPTNWQTGDVIDATKLNKAEQGIADASSIPLGINYGTPVYDAPNTGGGYIPVTLSEEPQESRLYSIDLTDAPTLSDNWKVLGHSGLCVFGLENNFPTLQTLFGLSNEAQCFIKPSEALGWLLLTKNTNPV